MFCVFGGPQTKSIVMFAGKDHLFKTGFFQYARPLHGIGTSRVKQFWTFAAYTPFPISKSIDRKMHKGICLQLVPGQLRSRRDWTNRCWWFNLLRMEWQKTNKNIYCRCYYSKYSAESHIHYFACIKFC